MLKSLSWNQINKISSDQVSLRAYGIISSLPILTFAIEEFNWGVSVVVSVSISYVAAFSYVICYLISKIFCPIEIKTYDENSLKQSYENTKTLKGTLQNLCAIEGYSENLKQRLGIIGGELEDRARKNLDDFIEKAIGPVDIVDKYITFKFVCNFSDYADFDRSKPWARRVGTILFAVAVVSVALNVCWNVARFIYVIPK